MNNETKMKLPSVKMVLFIGLAVFLVGYLAAAKPDAQEEGTEFGGIEIPFTDLLIKSPNSAFIWLTYYF